MNQATIGTDLKKAQSILENSGLVSIPTETVYGLAANAFDITAVLKIFEVKGRPTFDPLIVHTHSIDQVYKFVKEIPEKALQLMRKFWPGPLTILLERNDKIPDLVTAGSSLVAVRIPNHALTLKLLAMLDFPLAAPSANPFGYVSPTTSDHVNNQLGSKIDYILEGDPSSIGLESTIIGFRDNTPIIYRLGGLSIEIIEKEIGKIETVLNSSSKPQSPGMLTSHYSPGKTVVLGKEYKCVGKYSPEEVGAIVFKEFIPDIPQQNQKILSVSGDIQEAARNLFSALREMDALPIKVILAELVAEEGLGRAINDRLRRAAAKKE